MFIPIFFLFLVSNVCSIANKNETAEILYNLTGYALESRQNRFPYYQNPIRRPYGSYGTPYPSQHGIAQNFLKPNQNFGYYPQKPASNGVMEVLSSIAVNDKLRCVPRLLCEVTSDTISRGRQSFGLPTLPFNVNMESIIGLLSMIDVAGASPIPTFAKAALLGYISKGNSDSCLNAYPTCPREADKLVQYLNNYNGGFFRFFGGINPQPNYQNYYLPQYPQKYPYNNLVTAEQRIQNKPVEYVASSNNYVSGNAISFPQGEDIYKFNIPGRSPNSLTFPKDDTSYSPLDFRKPKELPYTIDYYYSNELDFQRPLPNHQATPMIFPDRTGTGELRLDSEELENYYKQSQIKTEDGYYGGVSSNNLFRYNDNFFPV